MFHAQIIAKNLCFVILSNEKVIEQVQCLFFSTKKVHSAQIKNRESQMKNQKIKNFLLWFLSDTMFLFSSASALSVRWARQNYPMQSFRNVYFVLSSDTSGHDSGTFFSALKGFLIPSLMIFIVYRIVLFILKKKNINLSAYVFAKLNSLYMFAVVLLSVILLKAWNYPLFAREVNGKPVSSEFYKENYTDPFEVKIIAPQIKRNLILIFMESMESSYATVKDGGVFLEDIIPNLSRTAKENVNFSADSLIGGGYNLEGTSWTGAGLISKLTGVPYFNPFITEKGNVYCLRRALSLGDVLKSQGYNLVFSMGSEKQFENRDAFLEGHGFDVHDIVWYKEHGFISKYYRVFWGFEDLKLYEAAKTELTELAKNSSPFCYGMLTIDTHFPYGYKCPLCKDDFSHPMMNILRCADSQVNEFINWCKVQSWFSNTTIVIMGDHCYLNAPDNNFIDECSPLSKKQINERRRFFNLIINPSSKINIDMQKNRDFSSFDMFPTVLECLGNQIEGGRLALGQSLLSKNPTLVEKYGEKKVNKEIMKRSVEYEQLR